MAYCDIDDILEQVSEDELIGLTDDSGTGVVDTAVSRSIADADSEIDSYCGTRYAVPFSTVPAIVRKLSVDIALYNLYSRRSHTDMPAIRQARYDAAIRMLKAVASGLVTLGADGPAPDTQDGVAASRSADDRTFTIGRKSTGSSGSLDNY